MESKINGSDGELQDPWMRQGKYAMLIYVTDVGRVHTLGSKTLWVLCESKSKSLRHKIVFLCEGCFKNVDTHCQYHTHNV